MAYNGTMTRPTRFSRLSVPGLLALALLLALLSTPVGAQAPGAAPAPGSLAGVRNFTQVDSTVACGGALSPGALQGIKEAGFKSVVNLRTKGEEDIDAEMKAAEDLGLTYIWLPFSTATPDESKVDAFLQASADPANKPMLVHCATGGRVSMFWAIKRVMQDGWPVEKAMNELPNLSKNVSQPLRDFTLDYIRKHGK
jgi:uncharacterized protein (TIGR01244 family)